MHIDEENMFIPVRKLYSIWSFLWNNYLLIEHMYNKTLQSYVEIYLQVYKFANSFVKKSQLLFIYMIRK